MFFNIESSNDWVDVKTIQKGWSSDKKYLVTKESGEPLLLRLSDIGQYEEKK